MVETAPGEVQTSKMKVNNPIQRRELTTIQERLQSRNSALTFSSAASRAAERRAKKALKAKIQAKRRTHGMTDSRSVEFGRSNETFDE
jgi:hypothetical protein